jgi:hypothetical protein
MTARFAPALHIRAFGGAAAAAMPTQVAKTSTSATGASLFMAAGF